MPRRPLRLTRPLALTAVLLAGATAAPALAQGDPVGELWLDGAETQRVRENVANGGHAAVAWQRTLAEANAALGRRPEKPDLSRWRSSKSLAEVYAKGNLDGQQALHLGYAWKVTGETRYAAKAKEFLTAWATNYANPPWPMRHQVDETIPMMTFALAYDMTKGAPVWSEAERASMRSWFARFVPRGKTWVTNNWKHINAYPGDNGHWANGIAWSLGMVALTGAQAGDLDAVRWATDRPNNMTSTSEHFSGRTYNLRRFITDGIRASGASEDEHQRRELGYGLFFLAPITVTAAAVDDLGIDLWSASPNGRSLKLAYEHYAPYIAGVKADPWPNSPLQPNKRRKYGSFSELAYRVYGTPALRVGVDWGSRGQHESEPLIGYGALLADVPPDLVPASDPVAVPVPPDAPPGAGGPDRPPVPTGVGQLGPPADPNATKRTPGDRTAARARKRAKQRALGRLVVTHRGRRAVVRVRARRGGTVRIAFRRGGRTVARCKPRFVKRGARTGCVRRITSDPGKRVLAVAVLTHRSKRLAHVRSGARAPKGATPRARSPR